VAGAKRTEPAASRESARPAAGERKQVTVLFADFCEFTAFSHQRDAEEVHDYMNSVLTRLDEVVTSHGGTIEKHIGDAIRVLFGDPQAREDDPERSVRAALAMQAALAEMSPDGQLLRLRIGIHTGLVVLGPLGAAGEHAALGDTVNLASRLEQNAPPGCVLISHDTYRHVFGLFDVAAQEPLSIKGAPEPIRTYKILRAKPRSLARQVRSIAGIETEMVGREPELGRLQATLRTVIEEQELRVLTVVGEAGIGKSRLMREIQKWVELLPEVVLLFTGRGTPEMTNLPFSLIRDVMASRFEIQESDSAAVAREKLERGLSSFVPGPQTPPPQEAQALADAHLIGHLLGLDFSTSEHLRTMLPDAEQVRPRAIRALARFFAESRGLRRGAGTSYSQGTLLVLEDLHWSDEGTLDLVDYLVREYSRTPLMVLCLARPALFERRPMWGEGQAAYSRLNLQSLTRRESRLMVESILRKAPEIPQALRELIVGGAEGNPFFLEEIIQMLIDERVIETATDPWQIEPGRLATVTVPPTLTGVLQARLDGLPWTERAVLQRAAVIGRTFWDSAVERLGLEAEAPAERSAPERNLARAEMVVALTNLRRKELILRRESSAFAGAVEYTFKHDLLRQVAYEGVLKKLRRRYHSCVAEWLTEQRPDRVREFGGLVAAHFAEAGQAAQAADWYGRAGSHALASYAPANAIDFFQKAIELAPPSAATANDAVIAARQRDWHEGLGEAWGAQARFAEAQAATQAALNFTETAGDLEAQSRLWNTLAFLTERQGNNRGSVDAANRAETLAREAGESEAAHRELIRALHLQGWAYYRLGDSKRVLELAERTLELCTQFADSRGIVTSLKLHGVGRMQLGEFTAADDYFARGLVLCQELGDRRNASAMWNNRGEIARFRGDFDAAEQLYQQALLLAREIGHRESEILYLSNLANARLGRREFAEAEQAARMVLQLAGAPRSCVLSETHSVLSEACLKQGKIEEALQAARHALELATTSECNLDLGGAWRALAGVAAAMAGGSVPKSVDPDPRVCFANSLNIFKRMEAECEAARTLRAWAEFELSLGLTQDARQRLAEARAIFERLGATPEVVRTDALVPKSL
jgi:class 3 adenylate cyclase/tetratricopeptide (TPR) repeat protein